MSGPVAIWEVVGGAAKGGLVVRADKAACSEEVPGRLATGALVLGLEYDADTERMRFEKVTGSGPETGWVNTMFKGKELLVLTDDASTDDASTEDPLTQDSEDISGSEAAEERADLAMQLYCARFGEADASEGEDEPQVEEAFSEDITAEQEVQVVSQLEHEMKVESGSQDAHEKATGLVLCSHCHLPVGEVAYSCDAGLVHGECLAQQVLRDLRAEEQKEQDAKADAKKAIRKEYEIGWKASEHIPSNEGPGAKLSCPVPEGMCCLVFQEESNSVSLASTVEPAAAVNLEYLSTALEVRRRNNREPLFSLDPADAGSEFFDPKNSMQVKRFEPAWLAGTSVGDVLFQSDYHLKELSMGEHEQPVIGMKSCHEYSKSAPEWNAREWFVVRKAEVQMSGDNVLMPFVKMGVEAREQILGDNGLQDVKTTKTDHPLVKYAETFTHNFDLIAERKSVVYHLRELAKASILAKFLVESGVDLDDSWFNLAKDADEACCMEVPQLWNHRSHAQIQLQDGKIVNSDSCFDSTTQRLYGGVQFGLDKFALSGARQPARMLSAGLAARQFVQPARHLSATLSAGLATRQFQRSFGPLGVQPARVSAGVGLDKFALSGARQPARMLSAGLAARQFVQPARHLSATLSAGLATRQFQRSFGPLGVQPARVSAGVGLDKFALSGARQPARMLSAGLAARQFVQPARHLSATLSAGLATRQFQRSFGPLGVQPARVSAGVGLDKFALSGARQPARMLSAGLAARQFVQPARHLSATLSAGLATRQFQRSFGPLGVQPARVSAGVGLDKFALSGARQPARMLSAGLAARQFVQPARHLSATLSAGLATRQFQRSFGPLGVQPARVSAGVGLDKFALSGARQPARMLSAGLAARQFVQPARHLSATLSAGLATRQFQRSFGPLGVQPARVSAGVGLDKFALSGARQPARMLSAGLAARQFVQPARHLSATLSAGLATRQFQRSFGPLGVQPARVSAGVGLDKFALSGARQPARMLSAGLAARQFVQPARHLSATLSAGLATRQFQRSFGPLGVQPARVSAGVGLDKFALSGARQPARMLSAGLAARQFVQPARHLSATLSAGLATRQFQRSFGPLGVQPARVAGVDLNLDEFNLTAPSDLDRLDLCVQLDSGANISTAFWSNLAGDFPSMFSDEDKQLLKRVFNPNLSDRHEEGELFVPPDTSFAYVQKLRALVKEEETVQQQRKEHFLSKAFTQEEPGPLFPASWASAVSVEVSQKQKQGSTLHPRPDYKARAELFDQVLKSATPSFKKQTEDGTTFRVYKLGSLEVRSMQEHDGQELVGAVFSSRPAVDDLSQAQNLPADEKIVKITEYVEKAGTAHHCYCVLETERENLMLAEALPDGTLKRESNPRDLEDRNSLAKVIRVAESRAAEVTIGHIVQCQHQADVFAKVSGDTALTGFRSL